MTNIETAIKAAIDGNWKPFGYSPKWPGVELKSVTETYITIANGARHVRFRTAEALLDPLAWQAMGKSLGWRQNPFGDGVNMFPEQWKHNMVGFMEHLADGDTYDEAMGKILET